MASILPMPPHGKLEDVGVVLLIGVDAVDADRPVVRRIAERAEVLVLAGREVEAHDLRAVRVLHPRLAVHLGRRHREVRLLRRHRPASPSGSDRCATSRSLRSNLATPVWYIRPTQMLPSCVELEVERALRMVRLLHRNGKVGHLAGARVELREELLAEMRVPDHAVRIDDHVVRLDFLPGKIVLGHDRPWWRGRSAAGRS